MPHPSRRIPHFCRPFGMALGCLLLYMAPCAHAFSAQNPQASSTSRACHYPAVTVEVGLTRDIAKTAYKAYEAHVDYIPEGPACAHAFRVFLSNVAYSQQAAGNYNAASRMTFLQKELTVRLKLFEDLNVAPLSGAAIAIYKNNIQRLLDIYEKPDHRAKPFLDDIISSDVNFSAVGSRLVRLRDGVRRAIYSCGKWDFSHAKNVANMRPQWIEQECETDFGLMYSSIDRFAEVAPAAAAYLRTKQKPSATTSIDESLPKEQVK